MHSARGIRYCVAFAACAYAAATPGAAATNIVTLRTSTGPLVADQQVEIAAFLSWNGPRGLYFCGGTLAGEVSSNQGRTDTVTLTQGSLPGVDGGSGCLTSYVGEVQVVPGNLPWSLTLERSGRGVLRGRNGIVVDWTLIDYQQRCVFSRKAAVKVTYAMLRPVELVWPVTTLKASQGSGSLCEREGKYSGELYLGSRGEQVEAVEEAVQ